MRTWKKLTTEEQQEIIHAANINGVYPTVKAYCTKGIKLYPDTLKYQLNEEYRQTIKQQQNDTYHTLYKFSEQKINKNKEYRQQRAAAGITSKKWAEWKESLSPEKLKKHRERIKNHRLNNIQHYKNRGKDNYEKFKQTTTLEERAEKRSNYRTRQYKDNYNERTRYLYKTDSAYKLRHIIRSHINRAITRDTCKQYTSLEYLGCTIPEFKNYIEKLFTDGMSWENHGRGIKKWHLDHIIPLASIRNTQDENLIKSVCNYKNYQPLWETENLQKSTKIEYPFVYTDKELEKDYQTILKKPGSYTTVVKSHKNILHFQPHFYEEELNILNKSPEIAQSILLNRQKYLNKSYITPEEMVYGLKISGTHYGYSHFPYQIIKKFIEDYNPQTIYDPCGGWGHRLLAVGDINYIYNDIWDQSFQGVHEMIKFHNIKNKILYNLDCTKFTPSEDYDCIFTCPPYYNTEIYSVGKYTNVSQYLEFLSNMLSKSIKSNVKYVGIVIHNKFVDYINNILKGAEFVVHNTELTKKLHHFANESSHLGTETIIIATR